MRAMKSEYGADKGEEVFYASRNKGTISGVDPESRKKRKKKRAEEMTTSVNIGSQGTATVAPRPKSRLHAKAALPSTLKKKKKPVVTRAIRGYSGREMADAKERVMQMVYEYEKAQRRRPR
jgi:hypothetical protein